MQDSNKSRTGRKSKHGKAIDSSGAGSESAFEFGYFYRAIEEHVNAYAADPGHQTTFSDTAAQLARLLEAASVRERLGGSELVPEMRQELEGNMRGRPARIFAADAGAAADVHVRTRNSRPLKRRLSQDVRDRIAAAQRKRWRQAKREEREERRARRDWPKSKIEAYSKAARGYWAKMTPAERSAEIVRRRKVALEKKRRVLEGK